jgi:uncharacterized membrane protein
MTLAVHIAAGLTAIVSGAVALYALKGARLHRTSGMIFVYSMYVMAALGALLSALRGQRLNLLMGVLSIYLVTTALLTVRSRAQRVKWIDAVAMLVALTVGAWELSLGFAALNSPTGRIGGMPATPAFIFGSLALLAGLGDVRMLLVGGLRGPQRIARHLWRMCFAMFIATGSLFLGQARVFPPGLRIMPLRVAPVVLVVLLMLYWLGRVLFTRRFRRT